MTLLGRLIRDRRGAAAVQFAVLAPALLLMVIGSSEVAILPVRERHHGIGRVGGVARRDHRLYRGEAESEERIRDVIIDPDPRFVDRTERRSAP